MIVGCLPRRLRLTEKVQDGCMLAGILVLQRPPGQHIPHLCAVLQSRTVATRYRHLAVDQHADGEGVEELRVGCDAPHGLLRQP